MATANSNVQLAAYHRKEAARYRERAAYWAQDGESDFAAVSAQWAKDEGETAGHYEALLSREELDALDVEADLVARLDRHRNRDGESADAMNGRSQSNG